MPLFSGDIILVQWRGRCFGQRILMDHTYRWEGTSNPGLPTSASLADLIDLIKVDSPTNITGNYLNCLPPQYTLEDVRAQVIDPVRSAYVSSAGDTGPGTFPTPTLTSNNTGVITFRTEDAGRNQISNRHIGPLPTLAETGGFLTNGYGTLLNTLANSMKQSIASTLPEGVFAPIIYHRGATIRYSAITNHIVNSTVRVQRRRTVGLGE